MKQVDLKLLLKNSLALPEMSKSILMLAEYFTPYDVGGSEWSIYDLADGLSKIGFLITIFTPNYGFFKSREVRDGFEVVRFPFYFRNNKVKEISPFWHSNILWFIWTTIFTLKFCIKNRVDIIHIQGKYFLLAALACKILLRKKLVITLRDYVLVCPIGVCLMKNRKCSFISYIFQDIPEHIKLYHEDKNVLIKFLLVLASIRLWIASLILRKLLVFTDSIVTISKIAKKIYCLSGVKEILVVPNSNKFLSYKVSQVQKKISNRIIYAGRLTHGKGVGLLIDAIPLILKKNPNLKFYFFGHGLLCKELELLKSSVQGFKKIFVYDYISHKKLLYKIVRSLLVVMPSKWPEPFGRIAIESISCGTPVVVTKNSGVAEVIKNKRWGIIVKDNPQNLALGILSVARDNRSLRKCIQDDRGVIKKNWSDKVYAAYAKIYDK